MPFWSREPQQQQPALASVAAASAPLARTGNNYPGSWWGSGAGASTSGGAAALPPPPPPTVHAQQPQYAAAAAPRTVFDAGNLAMKYYGSFPDNIKLIKQIRVSPLLFTATGAIDPRTRKKWVNFSLRETFFNGAFILHANRKSLEYRNNLPLPMTGVGSVVLAAEWRLGQALHKPRLMVALGTDAGAAVVRPGTVSWRKAAFPFNRHLGLEAAADASVAMQHDFADDRAVQGGFRLNLDVRELNLVLRV